MRQIPVSGGLFALVDDEDYDRLSFRRWKDRIGLDKELPRKWQGVQSKKQYTPYVRGTRFVDGQMIVEWMHRVVTNCPDDMEVDHIDRNGLNNQKSNLRVCSHRENLKNRMHKGSLVFDKRQINNPWRVTISGQYMASFRTKEDAQSFIDRVYPWTCFLPSCCWKRLAWKMRSDYSETNIVRLRLGVECYVEKGIFSKLPEGHPAASVYDNVLQENQGKEQEEENRG